MNEAIGLLEWKSLTRGIKATDTLLKTASVRLLQAGAVCPGKYLALFGGSVGSVQSALQAARDSGEEDVIDALVLARVDPAVFPALVGATEVAPGAALGIIETFSAVAAVRAADAVAKAAAVTLIEVRLARGLGGKALVLYSGEVSAVRLAGEAAARAAAAEGLLVAWDVIPSPHEELWPKLL